MIKKNVTVKKKLCPDINWIQRIKNGEISILAQTITALESKKTEHRIKALRVLEKLLPFTGKTLRIGISGPPGAGKSTFIEQFGLILANQGHKIAILTIDPSSNRTGGSILGDKTRMQALSIHPNVYIRPSPSSGMLGGIAYGTQEAMLICEAAGYDLIFIETIGVGQSEINVSHLVDCFLVILSPASGDELQAIKRGLIELTDILIVNKTDGEIKSSAIETAHHYQHAMKILPSLYPEWQPPVLNCSSIEKWGLSEIWQTILNHQTIMKQAGYFNQRRKNQRKHWFKTIIENDLLSWFYSQDMIKSDYKKLEKKVIEGKTLPSIASNELIHQGLLKQISKI